MSVSTAFRELARFLDDCDSGRRVTGVELSDLGDVGEERVLTAEIEITGTTCPSAAEGEQLSLASTAIDDDGTLECSFRSVAPVVPTGSGVVDVNASHVTVDGEGSVTVTVAASVRTDAADGAVVDEQGEARGSKAADGGETTRQETAGDTGSDVAGTTDDGGSTENGAANGTADGTATSARVVDDAGGDRDLPPFRDPDRLSAVYESCDTFAEMADALEMDVTSETVRRYMIDFGIHEPTTYDTGGDASDGAATADGSGPADESPDGAAATGSGPADETGEAAGDDPAPAAADHDPASGAADDATRGTGVDGRTVRAAADDGEPVILPDGIGLPEDVTAEGLVETVKQSNTVYEFKRDVGVDRENALEMLRELDLLDILVGRIATEAERDLTREEIIERLREATGQG